MVGDNHVEMIMSWSPCRPVWKLTRRADAIGIDESPTDLRLRFPRLLISGKIMPDWWMEINADAELR